MEKPQLKIDWKAFIRWYNLTLKQYGSAVAPLAYLTKGKCVQVQRLINELGTKQVLVDAVVNMARSDLLNGRTRSKTFPQGFVASFPWLVANDERLADVANGRYDNPPEHEPTAEELRRQQAEQREAERQRQREEARRYEEEERQRRRRERDAMYAGAVHGEELEKILRTIQLPFVASKGADNQ